VLCTPINVYVKVLYPAYVCLEVTVYLDESYDINKNCPDSYTLN